MAYKKEVDDYEKMIKKLKKKQLKQQKEQEMKKQFLGLNKGGMAEYYKDLM